MCLRTPARTNKAARSASKTAQESSDNFQGFSDFTGFVSALMKMLL